MPLPPRLGPQSRLAVTAASSGPLDAARTAAGLKRLEQAGFRVVEQPVLDRRGYLAAPDDARVAHLNGLLARKDVDAIVALRGGYGLLRILDRVDYAAALKHPKLVVGYSDVTALQLALYAKCGLPSLSGPMVASDWPDLDADTLAQLQGLLKGEDEVEILGPGGEALAPMRPGTTEGVLLGGNLSLVAALLGTPYLPDLTGAILFLEDVSEPPYRIDGLLARLRLAGVLDRIGGLVLGAFTGADPAPNRPSLSLDEVLADYTASLQIPVARGLCYGHFTRKSAVPVGVRARLAVTGGAATLTTLEPLTA